MAIISQLAPVNGLIDSVKGLVSEWRKPSLKSEDFASVLRERMRASNDPATLRMRAEKLRNAVDRSAERFLDLRDYDGDQMLTQEESGMQDGAFKRLDADADGKLTLNEMKKPALDAIARMYPDTSTHV